MVYFGIPVSYTIDPLITASWGYCAVSTIQGDEKYGI
tara:strand:+ start:904 stop:1014 length:111 start_codon:yes stop_codon:yes gene_type:complete